MSYQQPQQPRAGDDFDWRPNDGPYQPMPPYDALPQLPTPKKKHRVRNYLIGALGGVTGFLIVQALLPAPKSTHTPTVVLTASGSGSKNTAAFTTGGAWSIAYSFDCSSGGQGTFAVTVYDSAQMSDTPINKRETKGSGKAYEPNNWGPHYLSVNSECSWTLKVTDGDSAQ